MEDNVEKDLLVIFTQSVSNNFDEIKSSEQKISAIYTDPNKENYIKILFKLIMYPYVEQNEKKNIYDNYLNINVKTSILISIKNFIKKSIHSNLESLEISNDLCIIIKHLCMHLLLDINNNEIKQLDKYLFEILMHLFKYNISDEYDYILFYLTILYINDGDLNYILSILNSDDKKNNINAMKNIECIMLYAQNKFILQNINQNNYHVEFNKIMENINNIKNIINNRNTTMNDDIVNCINDTKKIYTSNDKHNLFVLDDYILYNISKDNNSLQANIANCETNPEQFIINGLNFMGKGTILKDYNNNVKIIDLLKLNNGNSTFKNMDINKFRSKYIALKILRKIIKKYKDNGYVAKFDIKIILTHIEYPLTLYFIYLYNKFREYTNYINIKLSERTNTYDANLDNEMNICFYTINDILMNIYIFLKVFYNINTIDLPEYYEDNFDIFYNIFYNFITYDIEILRNYFLHLSMVRNFKFGINEPTRCIANTHNIDGKFYLLNANGTDLANKLTSNDYLNKLLSNFEKNILKCKIITIDIIKIMSERYQDESKAYIIKLIYSLIQILYKEKDKSLLCHNYNCLSATIKLIHHMNLEKNDLNPYKETKFLEKVIECVLQHIRLKYSDIEEILEADLDYFRNDLNNSNAFSIKSTAIYFLKTLCSNYFDICFPILEFKILSKDSFLMQEGRQNDQSVASTQAMGSTIANDEINSKSPFYEPCNMEYKIQLITCLNQINLSTNFYQHNIKNDLKNFVISIYMKCPNFDSLFYNVNDNIFQNQQIPNTNNSNSVNMSDKLIWLKNEDIFNSKNTIYLLSILKFILNNRNICTNQENIADIFSFLYHLLFNEKNMIHNYSCLCINRLLNCQINKELLDLIYQNVIINILNRLLFLLKYNVYNKILNEYILITILRIFMNFSDKISNQYTILVLQLIDNTIKIIINDSHNPIFNHYLFELFTLIISLIYKQQDQTCINIIEDVVISTFSKILELYIHDFIPYIFQILSIIINNTNQIKKVHLDILTNLYQIDLWKSSVGNPNGIICVLTSYFKKHTLFQDIIKNNMQQLFNIYHYCLSNKKISIDSFQIILIIFTYLPLEYYQSFLKPLFVLLFTFLQQYKNDIIKIKVIHSLSVFILKTDAAHFLSVIDQVQNGLIFNVLKSLYMPVMDKLININEKIIIFLALTKIINNEKIKNDPLIVEILNSLDKNITKNELVMKKSKTQQSLNPEKDEVDKDFEVTYVKLQMINNENINETVLRNVDINNELKKNLYNPEFLQICSSNGFNNILQLFSN
ncbi:importin alpha re-exporter, putative [Plasmodium vinckei]|uniref:Importin alpha re-exporter, putative n=1 Tax=Plasmodium vinckei TaxID=5860 RepID=A0A6V7SW32_PLAVN|nr:importin alpha re-exporter, putative [Plasmodium vinckei]